MAEFYYFWTKQEMLAFLNSTFEAGFTVHINKDVTTPTFVICNTAADIEVAVLQREFSFVLTRADITRYQFKLRSFMRDDVEFWYFNPRVGGPCIEVYFYDIYEDAGKSVVPSTLLTYHSKILHPETDQFELAGEAIKMEFNAMTALLRKKAKKVKSIRRTAYVSPGVVTLLKSDFVLAKPFDVTVLSG